MCGGLLFAKIVYYHCMSLETSRNFTADQLAAMEAAAGLQDYLDLQVRTHDGMPPLAVTGKDGVVYASSSDASMRHASRSYGLPQASGRHLNLHFLRLTGAPTIKEAGANDSWEVFRRPENAAYSNLHVAYTGLITVRTRGQRPHEQYTTFRIHEPDTPLHGQGLIIGGMKEIDYETGDVLGGASDLLAMPQIRELRETTLHFIQYGTSSYAEARNQAVRPRIRHSI